MSDPIYRTATAAEIAAMLDWAAAEGWNPGQDDAAAFRAADPEGFFIAEVSGTPVAAISVVTHSDTFAFLGLYLCRPAFRGQGIGYALWTHAMAHAGDRTIGLDGVPAQEANYARSGFVRAGATRRLQGPLPATPRYLSNATEAEFAQIAQLDHAANGFARPDFLRTWTAPSATRKTVVTRDGDTVTGVATVRLCREGCKIGPVLAPDAEAAFALAGQAAAALDQTEAIIDLPDSATAFDTMLRGHGFVETFATARMYRGPAPAPGANLQAIATMELG